MSEPTDAAQAPAPKSGKTELLKTLAAAALVVAVVLGVQATVLKPYRIPSGSMLSTLKPGDRVLVSRQARVHVGDVVVFPGPKSLVCAQPQQTDSPCGTPPVAASDTTFIKRVVAGPGDTVSIANGRLVRNGRVVHEPYTEGCSGQSCDLPRTITVPKGHWYVLGDNRGASADSRYWGPVPQNWLHGQAVGIYWPPSRAGGF